MNLSRCGDTYSIGNDTTSGSVPYNKQRAPHRCRARSLLEALRSALKTWCPAEAECAWCNATSRADSSHRQGEG